MPISYTDARKNRRKIKFMASYLRSGGSPLLIIGWVATT